MAFKISVTDLIYTALEKDSKIDGLINNQEKAKYLLDNHDSIREIIMAGLEMEIIKFYQYKLQEKSRNKVSMV